MEHCDVLIVGGGPAGSTCAWGLHLAGHDVIVLDKERFPRDKVCAGWVTRSVVAEIDFPLSEYRQNHVLEPITGFCVGRLGDRRAEVRYSRPIGFGIRRCEFDRFLLERSGARLRLGEKLERLERHGQDWLVNGEILARVVVGAGGHFCPVARHLGLDPGTDEVVVAAQETEFRLSGEEESSCRATAGVPELYFTRDLRGYGWLFRKGGFLNVGLGRRDKQSLAAHVAAFLDFLVEQKRIGPQTARNFRGHAYLLYGDAKRVPVADGALLLGDAAGLAYNRSGEGIRPAVESGLLAARTITGIFAQGKPFDPKHLAPYQEALLNRFGRRTPTLSRLADSLLPERLRAAIAGKLIATDWFSRHVLINRWFLHLGQPPLSTA